MKKKELLSFAQSAKDVLRAVEETAKRELGGSLQSSIENAASQLSTPPCERAKIVIAIQDKDGLKQFRVYMVYFAHKVCKDLSMIFMSSIHLFTDACPKLLTSLI